MIAMMVCVARSPGSSPPRGLRTWSSTMKSASVMPIAGATGGPGPTPHPPPPGEPRQRAEHGHVDETAPGVEFKLGAQSGQSLRKLAADLVEVDGVEGAKQAERPQEPQHGAHSAASMK